MPPSHKSIAITDRSSIGEARRAAVSAAQLLGFDEDRRSDIGIAATELASNILQHAREGELLVCPGSEAESAWLDLTALDTGAGISDITRAMSDGYSTAGTSGQGLGAVQRLSNASSLFSSAAGVAHWSRFMIGPETFASTVGVVNIPIRGESVAGDSFLLVNEDGRRLYMMVDGLGHGSGAAEAASEAVQTVQKYSRGTALDILMHTHDALKKTRGAALSLVIIEPGASTLTYAGVGNISALVIGNGSQKNLVSHNGTLGAGVALPRTTQEYVVPFTKNTLLVLYSDGLTSKVSLAGYPGYASRPPALLAGLLYRDFTRGRDDASVMVAPLGGAAQ